MRTEHYVLKSKHNNTLHPDHELYWMKVPFSPMFRSEEEAKGYYDRNKDFINESVKGKDVGVFKITRDEYIITEVE